MLIALATKIKLKFFLIFMGFDVCESENGCDGVCTCYCCEIEGCMSGL